MLQLEDDTKHDNYKCKFQQNCQGFKEEITKWQVQKQKTELEKNSGPKRNGNQTKTKSVQKILQK